MLADRHAAAVDLVPFRAYGASGTVRGRFGPCHYTGALATAAHGASWRVQALYSLALVEMLP
jgi:hypothetical protein